MSYILDALKRAETTKNEKECILPVNQTDAPPKKFPRLWVIFCLIILICLGLIGIYFKFLGRHTTALTAVSRPKNLDPAIQSRDDALARAPAAPPIETKPELELKPEQEPETNPEPDVPKPSIIPQLIEMPPAFQNSIPSLQFKGHFYSTNPEKGSVLISDKIYSVGSEIAPGIILEAVTPTGVILNAHHIQFRIEILGNWVY